MFDKTLEYSHLNPVMVGFVTKIEDWKYNWTFLKNRILKLFIQSKNSFEILMELKYLFLKNIEPVRPAGIKLRI